MTVLVSGDIGVAEAVVDGSARFCQGFGKADYLVGIDRGVAVFHSLLLQLRNRIHRSPGAYLSPEGLVRIHGARVSADAFEVCCELDAEIALAFAARLAADAHDRAIRLASRIGNLAHAEMAGIVCMPQDIARKLLL